MKLLHLGIVVRVRQTYNTYQFIKYIHVHFTANYWAHNMCMVQGTGTVQKIKTAQPKSWQIRKRASKGSGIIQRVLDRSPTMHRASVNP